ncbi:MAG: hypothetical protein ACOCXQ_01885 [Patescibacteria group bacterium]
MNTRKPAVYLNLPSFFIGTLVAGLVIVPSMLLFMQGNIEDSVPPETEQYTYSTDYRSRSIHEQLEPTPLDPAQWRVFAATEFSYLQIPLDWYVSKSEEDIVTFSNIPVRTDYPYPAPTDDEIRCTSQELEVQQPISEEQYYTLDNGDLWPGGAKSELSKGGTGERTREVITYNLYNTYRETEMLIQCIYKLVNNQAKDTLDAIMKTIVVAP